MNNTNTNTTNFNTATLATSAILVNLTIRKWGETKSDKRKTDELIVAAHAKKKVARVHKSLLPDCAELKAINDIAKAARDYLNEKSFPWIHRAHNLLPMAFYQEVVAEMRMFIQDYNDAVAALEPVYVQRQYEARADLGDLYDPEDYPSFAEVRARYSMEVEFSPVPEAGHFVVDLQNQAKDELVEMFHKTSNTKWAAAFAGVCEELKKTMTHLLGKVDDSGDKSTRMHASLIPNIRKVIEKVRMANAMENNADVEAAASGLESLLSNISVEALKTNETARIQVREGVNNILDKFNF